jgi:thiol:disulfide interchange protein/DsbC/DsbD-like thiol-disulfide interchange protein
MSVWACLRAVSLLPRLLRQAGLALLACGALAAVAAPSSVVTTERVRAELLAHAPEGVAPGKTVWLGLQLAHQPQWHTYWKNPGDSGLPTTMAWTLPAGLTAGDIDWPVPRKFPIGHLANYGYEGTVLLPVPVTVGPDFRPSPLSPQVTVRLKAQWLVCKTECIPEEGEFALSLPVQGATALHAAVFDAALKARPQGLATTGTRQARIDGQALELTLSGLPARLQGQTLAVFFETGGLIETAATPRQRWQDGTWTAQVPLSPHRAVSPAQVPVVVAAAGQGWRVELPVAGTWPALPPVATVPPALEDALRRNAQEAGSSETQAGTPASFLLALLGALIGGLILNLMPCVFPVLAVKVVGFAQHGADARTRRIGGLAYTAGVVAAFIALGAMLLALRAAGEQLGWGFQLQSPAVVAALAVLFTLIGLNLAGVFEVGQVLPSRLASLQARHPAADACLSGLLAVAIASPCTAPFMGASLGLAVTLPPAQALALFATLGLGMALPYLAASLWPAVGRWLPRPGAWMDVFRRLMAFPMFATVAWLVWVLGQQNGIDGAAALLVILITLALVAWSGSLQGRARRIVAMIGVIALAGAAWSLGPWVWRAPATATSPIGAGIGPDNPSSPWQPWSATQVDALLAQGRPVFVDFTAAWCVTCQYNKATTLADRTVLAAFAARNVALLRADWTRRDPAITAALAALGRTGVPVYVLYAPGRAPRVLTELLSPAEVQAALAAL